MLKEEDPIPQPKIVGGQPMNSEEMTSEKKVAGPGTWKIWMQFSWNLGRRVKKTKRKKIMRRILLTIRQANKALVNNRE